MMARCLDHPDVEESAMVGVATDVGEQDIKVFVRPAASPTCARSESAIYHRVDR